MASLETISVQAPVASAQASLSVPFTESLHRKSAESLQVGYFAHHDQNLYQKIKENQSFQKMKSIAGSTATTITQAPSNLKLRIRSVVSQLQSMRVTSSDRPTFYLALYRGFLKLYEAPRFTETLPLFEDYYEEVSKSTSGVFTEAQVQAMRRQAYLFFDEVRKQADDRYARVSDVLLVALAVLIDAEFLKGKTRTLLNLVYINTLNERSEKSSPSRAEVDDETDFSEHNEEDLPQISSIDKIQLEDDTFLQEFIKKFEDEVTWEELDSKSIAKACQEYHEIAKLSEEERRQGSQKKELSYLQVLQLAILDLLSTVTDKSLQFYEQGITLLEKQFPEAEKSEENEEEIEDQGQDERSDQNSYRERLRKLNDRLSKLIKRESSSVYQGTYKVLHVREIQQFLQPYLEASEPYYKSLVDQGRQVYNFSMKTVVLPVRENVVLVFNTGARYYSVVVGKVQDTETFKYVQGKFGEARVQLHAQYLKLDFDNDGVVSVEDCKATANEVAQTVRNYEYREKGMELYERAKQRMKALMAPSK